MVARISSAGAVLLAAGLVRAEERVLSVSAEKLPFYSHGCRLGLLVSSYERG